MRVRKILIGMTLLPFVGCGQAEQADDAVGQSAEPVTIVDQAYQIKSVLSGKCAAVDGASQVSGAAVVQLPCTTAASQNWQFRQLSTDIFELKNENSDLCLAVVANSSQNGQNLVQAACGSTGNLKWRFVDSSGAFLIKPQSSGANDRKCMDLRASSTASGLPLIQWDCHGGYNQRWSLLPLDGGGGGGGGGGEPPSGPKVTYAIDSSTIFANPERGFYHHQETSSAGGLSQSTLSGYRTNEAISLILRLYYLGSFRTANISASYLSGMTTDFERLRAAGIKAVVRFAYTSDSSSPYGDATPDRVLAHIAQLKPILRANADVIATLQVGFIGAWGEWYYTDYFGDQNNISSAQWADRKAVTDALLDALPASRTVQLRTPAFKQRFYGASALTSAQAFSETAKARVGHHNDCFLASSDDLGTYGNVSADKTYLGIEGLYVPQGGETCATSSYSGWANASADMEKLRYSYLNRDYFGAVYTSWGSNLDTARRRLGYRLALVDATFDSSVRPGGELKANLGMRNDGYAPPYNPRGVEIIARHASTGARLFAKLPFDARRFAPGTTQRIDARLCVGAGTPVGTYNLFVSLPDSATSLHDRPEYAIRLANPGLWDAATGHNSLKQSITVSASSTSAACSTGSVPLVP